MELGPQAAEAQPKLHRWSEMSGKAYRRWLVAFMVLQIGTVATVRAQTSAQPSPPSLPPVDLGQTNILDGEGKPGIIIETIGFGSVANRLADNAGNNAVGHNRQRIGSLIVHPIFTSSSEIVGAHPGFEVLAPVTDVDNSFSTASPGSRLGQGDVTFAPFLQWSPPDPKPGAVSARLALQIVAPTGSYTPGRPANTGQGGYQISPYLAVTWRASERWEVSGRAIYDHSGSTRLRMPDGLIARARPGDLVAANLSISYQISPDWRIGPGGYVLQQLNDATMRDRAISEKRERVFALGPVTRWQQGDTTVLAGVFGEFGARNRPEGIALNIRLQRPL